MNRKSALLAVGASLALTATAAADEILVDSDITTSTVWTADNTYNLTKQIYVRNGATLTIEAGTLVASDVSANGSGSLAVTRTSQIFVNGTAENPVIMTSKADVATWTDGDPRTGTWREAANEWGNLTLMGTGYISEDELPTNTSTPNPQNIAAMEGLVAEGTGGFANVVYGGGDDDHDGGSISYLSLRYGGRVIGLANELNGMSIGGVGQETDIHHVEIMNNVDDGFEIWGGKVNLKYFSVWNVGDDSLDIDQGWRGKAQFGLIVQGWSLDQSQGSGVGDNAVETDGAEDSDWQPVTTGAIYNLTVIGQPIDGDGLTTWRDGARIQYRNSIFMDGGEAVVKNDGSDGDGAQGYGHNGTLPFYDAAGPDIWDTSAATTSPVNAFGVTSGAYTPAQAYTAQDPTGFLAEIRDSVFWRNTGSSAYTNAALVGAVQDNLDGTYTGLEDNVWLGNDNADIPIAGITREAPVVKGNNKTMLFVSGLDPRANGVATTSVAAAPNDGFYTPAQYRGAFGPEENWLAPWSASYAFGFLDNVARVDALTSPLNLGTATTNAIPAFGQVPFRLVADLDTPGACGVGIGTPVIGIWGLENGGSTLFPLGGCAGGPADLFVNLVGFKLTGANVYVGGPVNLNFQGGIPNDTSFLGGQFVMQAVWLSPGGERLGQAVRCTVGYGA